MTARKIVAGLFISLDGVVETPQNWHFPYLSDEMGTALGQLYAAADTLLLGRRTYEEFAAVWPHQSGPMADQLNAIAKLVVSSTLADPEWQNTTVLGADPLGELAGLKEQAGGNITVTGSATLIRALLRAELLDELRLLVHPLVVGKGQRLFDHTQPFTPLTLAGSAELPHGVLDLRYHPA